MEKVFVVLYKIYYSSSNGTCTYIHAVCKTKETAAKMIDEARINYGKNPDVIYEQWSKGEYYSAKMDAGKQDEFVEITYEILEEKLAD